MTLTDFDLPLFSQWLSLFIGSCGFVGYAFGYKLAIARRFVEMSAS